MDGDDLRPFEVDVGDGHVLHVRTAGGDGALPALFLHGGPGSGCQPGHARMFDARFRVVLPDQRGAGLSRPKRGLHANTTPALVADLEAVRARLGIERWLVVGGSWGSTLALAYAEAHPERVLGLVLRAVFLGTREESRWAFEGAAQAFRPDLWAAFRDLLPEGERGDPVAAYGRRLEDPDPRVHRPAAEAWAAYEGTLSLMAPPAPRLPAALGRGPARDDLAGPNTPYVEWHYLKHDFFLAPGQLLDGAGRLAGIPGRIVQGRYDLLCPPAAADALARAWPGARLRIVPAAGHAGTEAPIRDAVARAIADIAPELGA